ncbi:MAG: hypothetical protein QM775_31130 [Pirellulales bacterium]
MKLVGTLLLHKEGRPEHVYCTWYPKQTELKHEVMLTTEMNMLWPYPSKRGKFVDRYIRPDGTVFIKGKPMHFEIDRATEGYRQVKRRMLHYVPSRELVVFVAPTEARMNGIRTRAARIASHSFFKVSGSRVMYDFDGNEFEVVVSAEDAPVTDPNLVSRFS